MIFFTVLLIATTKQNKTTIGLRRDTKSSPYSVSALSMVLLRSGLCIQREARDMQTSFREKTVSMRTWVALQSHQPASAICDGMWLKQSFRLPRHDATRGFLQKCFVQQCHSVKRNTYDGAVWSFTGISFTFLFALLTIISLYLTLQRPLWNNADKGHVVPFQVNRKSFSCRSLTCSCVFLFHVDEWFNRNQITPGAAVNDQDYEQCTH